MASKNTAPPIYPKIRETNKKLPRIDPSAVAAALGAESTDLRFSGIGSPLTAFQVRQELLKRLHSTGGRPSLSDVSRRVKIPLSATQWEELENIATEVTSPGFTPSAGQIASVLLSLSLRSLRKEGNGNHPTSNPDAGALSAAGG
jgi:hypothetical protein